MLKKKEKRERQVSISFPFTATPKTAHKTASRGRLTGIQTSARWQDNGTKDQKAGCL